MGKRLERDPEALARFDGATLTDPAQLRELRHAAGLRFDEAAKRAGYHPSTVATMEARRYGAKFSMVRDLLEVLGFELVLRRRETPGGG